MISFKEYILETLKKIKKDKKKSLVSSKADTGGYEAIKQDQKMDGK